MTSPPAVAPLWLDLEGAENVRDVGGLITADGAVVQPGRLIRSDSLQDLTPADVRYLVDDLHVRAVADLRTGVELRSEGPGPLTREPTVDIVHLSLFPETGESTGAAAADDNVAAATQDDAPVILPWQARDGAAGRLPEEQDDGSEDSQRRGAATVYLRYLDERGDSILAALRLIAYTDGATIVHCAAGKDRTGTVVALALSEVGVVQEAIVEDYARSAERIERIFARLGRRRTYAREMQTRFGDVDKHRPRAATMQQMLVAIDEVHGGASTWLRANGWTEDDAAALRRALLG